MAGGLRVLVVDDIRATRELVMRYLQPAGYTVTCAGSGEEALVALSEGQYDLVVSDTGMLGMGGLELCSRIKKDYQLVKVVGMSELNHNPDGSSRAGAWRRAGADDFYQKGNFDRLVEIVNGLLGNS